MSAAQQKAIGADHDRSVKRHPALMLLFVILGIMTVGGFLGLDRVVALAVQDHVSGAIHEAAKAFSKCGRTEWYLIPMLLLLAWWTWARPRQDLRRICLWLLAAEAAGGLVSRLIKISLGRWRPNQMPDGHFGFAFFSFKYKSNSFPSGHAMDAAAVAAMLWFAYPPLRPLYVIWVIAMASARVLAMDHFVSDVAAGAMLGLACVVVARHYMAKTSPARMVE